MALFKLDQASLNFGTHILLDHVDFAIEPGDRIGLLGRNGAGKSTLLKVITQQAGLESGERWLRPGTKMAYLDQALPQADDQDVYDVVAHGLAEVGDLLARYHHCINENDMDGLAKAQTELEAKDGWRLQQRVETVITQLQLPSDAKMASLSGGWRRRVALGQALVNEPDILLLDEPTNHLDIPAIEWLERQLQSYPGAIVFITHDRAFLQSLATTITELDRGHLTSWQGTYHGFLRHREQQLAAEERANELFDKRLAEEEKWIRQGIKARRTRNEGRVRALKAMRVEHGERRAKTGKADFSLDAADRSGKRVAELEQVTQQFGDDVVIRNFSTLISRGDRIGIVGANGAGKSTLIKILLGELTPSSGTVKLGTKLEVAYFDQLRANLDPEKNLIDNVCGGQDFIEVDGKKRHAISYLGDFLFTPERVRTPVKALSGGEQNRAILAKLFSKPANLLVLDEPTNDLDVETLELLEEILLGFKGTVLLVSHDREFMDNVVTSVLVLEGNGVVSEHVGGYSHWVDQGGSLRGLDTPAEAPTASTAAPAAVTPTVVSKKKLSYKDQRELDALPAAIEELEQKQATLEAQVSAPDFYQQDHQLQEPVVAAISEVQAELQKAYQRWEELDSQ
ncbi:ATP-binding cassette domain-containing protein [Halieaceae bacterium IMCC14734]|uniref:ATP-binding protein Uup n=1 Tax=Candidatus Litorirhabdus singularis TaxID=2518993 RepID=A0ABT3TIM2_9GAMM|nr:ATP-binding cassette domain-containing protein [Candidatus Litorirhabdus singularis]MCX2982181.1 ATP-binding cassette domain-containing protein [Candidatus Litorirhabdus singularis]